MPSPSGLLASSNLSTTSDTVVYTAPTLSGTQVVCKIFVANRSGSATTFSLGLGQNADTTVSATNAIEFTVPLPTAGVLERGNVVLGAGQKIIARTSVANVSVAVCGVSN
jgi:hypothetical protein